MRQHTRARPFEAKRVLQSRVRVGARLSVMVFHGDNFNGSRLGSGFNALRWVQHPARVATRRRLAHAIRPCPRTAPLQSQQQT